MSIKKSKYPCINHSDRVAVVEAGGKLLCWQCYLPPDDYAAKFGTHSKSFRIAMIGLMLLCLPMISAAFALNLQSLKSFSAAWLAPVCPEAVYANQVPYGEHAADPNRVMAAVDRSLWINNDPNITWTESRWTGQYYYVVTASASDPNILLHITRYDRHTTIDVMRYNKNEDQIINLKDFAKSKF